MSKVQPKSVNPSSRRIRKISRTESECSRGEDDRDEQECLSPPDEDVLSYCEYHDIPAPPDGGYGWVIVFASFMCNMIVDGIGYTFGVFLEELVTYFESGKGTVAWVGSLLSGMYLTAGPVVSALTNKYGCRAVCIAGSIIGCCSFVFSTFAPNVGVLMLVYGFMGGVGFGLIYLPSVVCVGYYFETKRSLATGIAVCGSGVGTFAFSPFARILLEQYGWRGANLILAGIILNCAVFGALMKPLEFPKTPRQKPLLQRMADEKRYQMERGSISGSYFMVQLPDGTMEKRMKMPINFNYDPGVHSSFNLDQLSQMPGTPITPIPTLPTISEVKGTEHGSSGGSNESAEVKPVPERRKSRRMDEIKEEDARERLQIRQAAGAGDDKKEDSNSEFNKSNMPRNASQPSFTTHFSGLPKNGSVPFFDRIRKTSASERYRPTLQAIRNSSRTSMTSNGDLKKSMHLKLSTSSFGNNNCDDMWSKTDVDMESSFGASKMSLQRDRRELIRPMSRKDIFYSGSVVNLPEYQSQKSLAGYRQSVISLPRYGTQTAMSVRDVETGPPPDLCPCLSLPEAFKSALNDMMDISLLKDPVFLLIGISNVFGMAGLYVPFVYLVNAAVSEGVDLGSASFLISVIGFTNTVGRIACGYVADFPKVNSLFLNNICLVVSTLAVAAVPLCHDFASYVVTAVFFGIAISGYISLTSIILVDLLGLDKLTNAFGLLILFRGCATIIGSPLAGAVYDATGVYSIPFFMAGGFFAISALTSFLAPVMKRWSKPKIPIIQQDVLTPIDEDEEEDEDQDMGNGIVIPEITKTAPTPSSNTPTQRGPQEIEQIESVL
ncbi:UNVERIFIED_CONTAM: hypothetical protein PYX00_003373 [Menopon gallinae]|uniref:Monocarboxylate transporter n=1 Tax=Menopon gallinae TaxID=328185 RepID=A0AAW2HZL0_9NEOP